MIDPSNDWPAIEWLHAYMHSYRAIENGTPLFRPTDHGASVVADRLGRVLFWQSSSQGGRAFVFAAPIGAAPTLYSIVGQWLAWIAVGFHSDREQLRQEQGQLAQIRHDNISSS